MNESSIKYEDLRSLFASELHLITFVSVSQLKCFFFLLLRDVDPVVFAIRGGDVKAVNDLATSAPHSLLRENKDGWIALHDAAFCGQTECLKALLRGMTLKASLRVPQTVHFVQFESHRPSVIM